MGRKPTVERVVEAKLYAWTEFRRQSDYPPSLSPGWYRRRVRVRKDSDLQVLLPLGPRGRTSPQEVWAVRRARKLREAATIERAIRSLSERRRQLVWYRYVRQCDWEQVAKRLRISRSQVFAERIDTLRQLAANMGLTQSGEPD